jgi:hypothetical protein
MNLLMAGSRDRDPDFSKLAVKGAIRRAVANHISMSQIVGNCVADSIQLIGVRGQKSQSPGPFRKLLENTGIAILILRMEETDSVDNRSRLLHCLNYVFQAVQTCIITAVTEYEQRLSASRAAFQIFDTRNDGVVQPGLS